MSFNIKAKETLTSVCTMWGLCSLRLFTVWNTSRMPSAFTLSRTVLNAQKVPVRPAPALHTHRENVTVCRNCIRTRICCDSTLRGDIFWSSMNLRFVQVKTDRGRLLCVSPTCSALWWDGFRTAAVVFAPQQLCWSCPSHQWGFPPRASRGNGTDAPLEPYSPEKAQKNRFTCVVGNIPHCCWSFISVLVRADLKIIGNIFSSFRSFSILPCCWWRGGHALCSSRSPPPV